MLTKVIELVIKIKSQRLPAMPLDFNSIFIVVFVDAGFATNPDSSAQPGFTITIMDTNIYSKINHYGGIRSKRVTGNLFPAKIFAMIRRFRIYFQQFSSC